MSSSLVFPPATVDAVEALKAIAGQRWFKNEEIVAVLSNVLNYGLVESQTPPDQPSSGSIFVFNKRTIRTWRRDGHEWKKKKDGKNVMEHHEKLKVKKIERITCCYAHHQDRVGFHRRCYWLLESPAIVFVHYLQQSIADAARYSSETAVSRPLVLNLSRSIEHIQFYAKSKASNARLSSLCRSSPYSCSNATSACVSSDFSLRRERRAEVARQMRQRKKAHLQQLEGRIEYLSKQIEALDVRSVNPGTSTIRHDSSLLVVNKLAHDLVQAPSLSHDELEHDIDVFFQSITQSHSDARENLLHIADTVLDPGLQSKFALWSIEQVESKYLHSEPDNGLWYSVLQKEIDASPQQMELLSRHWQTARNLRLEHQHIARALHVCASNMAKYASEWHNVLERVRAMLKPLQMARLLVLLEHGPTRSPSPAPAHERSELNPDIIFHL